MVQTDVHGKEEVLVANLHYCKYEVLHKAVVNCGYTIQAENDTDENWDLCWSDLSVSIERVSRLKSFQRLNHFPGMLEICRKASLSRHLNRMCARLPHEYSFFPRSLVLDDQLDDLIGELKKNKAKIESGATNVPTYILKPSGGTMGRGITLVQTLQQLQEIPDISNMVAQAYVPNPLLLDGFKFDIRIYALVASIDPLRIFLYDEGLARLATDSYHAPTADNLRSATMHLTNYAINRGTQSGLPQAASSSAATKRPASEVLQAVAHAGNVSKASLVNKIAAIVVKTVLAVQPLLAHTYHTGLSVGANQQTSDQQPCTHWGHMFPDAVSPNGKAAGNRPVGPPFNTPITTNPCGCAPSKCFEILGFDILFDEQLQPWLLEVNHSPSFACDTKLDYQVKSALITDTLLALNQTSAEKAAYMEHECKALAQRLYAPASSGLPTRRRPLSGLPRSRQLHVSWPMH
ncbi:tubulin-tyrosine ligase family-domain-containing protein [Dunaliella salina]|uniref:Tubulin-tyrosine ligase family-domain-containing protein n=1 Tax=Dunaliella salina TaxID=3046 RepID=A0ABQ7G344_DUNSA|nr:tubulin-tyrosine ligase family-domain-containing protein [Dunaliella salina]|eukprot:KAF5829028.1 tubulin-tyrosine ligase family-domain-containing protein [Dunaliella salina]